MVLKFALITVKVDYNFVVRNLIQSQIVVFVNLEDLPDRPYLYRYQEEEAAAPLAVYQRSFVQD